MDSLWRRQALEQCGGWNEETITDDLDLTMRIHFSGWDIHLLLHPPVGEEGVERPLGPVASNVTAGQKGGISAISTTGD